MKTGKKTNKKAVKKGTAAKKKVSKKIRVKSATKVQQSFPKYDHAKIEKKWQKVWADKKFYQADDKRAATEPHDKKFFALVEFPFPSGAGLHTGHTRSYTAMDVISRKRRAQGQNVLYPIGWDAFGLPTENYAIKTGLPPQKVTKQNTDTFRRQLKSVGISFDWSREVNTTDPSYYKWTQWIFLQMYKKGLAYKSKMTINWCPKDKIGLANEEVVNGCCERCGTQVEKRDKEQWMLAITKYADRLDSDLDTVDYWEKIKIQQRNWIGKSEGAEVDFAVKVSENGVDRNFPEKIKVFTTRIDTLFGVTYLVVAPESELIQKFKSSIENFDEVQSYIQNTQKKDEMDRTAEGKEKTGVPLKGVVAINPANGEEIPVWTADYVLASYGTGAVMAVPAHDERDFEFAKKFNLPIKTVLAHYFEDQESPFRPEAPNVERENVHVILRDSKNKKVLCLDWKDLKSHFFVVGGIEAGEDAVAAAKRELAEETGYTNIAFVREVGRGRARYYAAHKNENRIANSRVLLFELVADDHIPVADAEKKNHQVVWVDESKVLSLLHISHKHKWEYAAEEKPFCEEGSLVESGKFDKMTSKEAKKAIAKEVGAKIVTKYKLRDWIFSRQRYWGEPIPMINCEKCGWVPVSEKDLPVVLPPVKKYEPTDDGESPLSAISSWVNTKCPECKGKARRETDTMPNWAGSSWYFLRYIDPKNKKALADPEKIKNWMQVDWYNGGMEHTTLHLLYSRFWHKFLYDIGVVNTAEPYAKRTSHGLILAEGGVKMSKSLGNVVNPDDLVKLYGADTLRTYQLFMGPFDQAIAWNTSSMIGSRRFIERVYGMAAKVSASRVNGKKTDTGNTNNSANTELETLLHKTIKKVGEDIEALAFNTAISSMMILMNAFDKEVQEKGSINRDYYEAFLKLLAPIAPHVTDEIWSQLGNKKSIHLESWPTYDANKLQSSTFKIIVQINSKVRANFMSQTDDEESVKKQALALPEIQTRLQTEGITDPKSFYVKGKLINFVAGK